MFISKIYGKISWVINMVKSELFEIFLPFPNKEERRVRVYVPIHEEGEKLPVIYMTDGQNIFDEESCPYGCWHTMEAVEEAIKNGDGGAVIVGIDHGGKWRDNELTPSGIGTVIYPEEMKNFTEPEGEIFDSFLMNTVKPYVEKNFPVKIGKRYTAICGSSSGGLQSFFTGLEHPDSFAAIGAFSPALILYGADDIRNWLLSKLKVDMPYLYIYTGRGDELEEKIFLGTEMTYDILMEIGYPYDRMNEVIMLGYKHNETAWEEIFRDFLHLFLDRCK